MERHNPLQEQEVVDLIGQIKVDRDIMRHASLLRKVWRKEEHWVADTLIHWCDDIAEYKLIGEQNRSYLGDGLVLGLLAGEFRYKKIEKCDITQACDNFLFSKMKQSDDEVFATAVLNKGGSRRQAISGLEGFATKQYRAYKDPRPQPAEEFSAGMGFGLFLAECAVLNIGYESPDDTRREWARKIASGTGFW